MSVSSQTRRPVSRPSSRSARRRPARPRFEGEPAPFVKRKYTFDRLLAALLLVPALPVIGLLILAVRATSRGPGIFRQARVGKDGRVFTMYKIRTMRHGAEEGVGATWSTRNDPRSTRVGRWIRALHLDELPQLFNVLHGDMAMVGPRPERPEFVAVLEKALPGYRNRLRVRPGITGLAQLRLPPDADLCSACRKLTLDLEYIRQPALVTDLRLLLCTLIRLPKLPLSLAFRLCGLRATWAQPNCARCRAAEANGRNGANGHNGCGHMTAVALRSHVAVSRSGGNGAPGRGAHDGARPPAAAVGKPR